MLSGADWRLDGSRSTRKRSGTKTHMFSSFRPLENVSVNLHTYIHPYAPLCLVTVVTPMRSVSLSAHFVNQKSHF